MKNSTSATILTTVSAYGAALAVETTLEHGSPLIVSFHTALAVVGALGAIRMAMHEVADRAELRGEPKIPLSSNRSSPDVKPGT